MKHSQILIDIDKNISSVALLEDGRLNEFYVELNDTNLLSGNIYKGKVINVLQGLQTAFVDIGLNKNAFLYVGETLDDRSDLRKSGVIPAMLNVKEGDYVMVQVTKEETQTKGARLTMNISLPGRYVVYLPTIDFTGISNKITDEKIREKLTKQIEKLKSDNDGFIARTVCMDAKKNDIAAEAKAMKTLYKTIKTSYDECDGIGLIHSEGNLLQRSVRDMLHNEVDAIICNDFETCEKLRAGFKRQNPKFYDLVHFYESDYDIMDVFGVARELDKLLERKVALPSGGSLVIDKTEALTAIDVNTGSFRGQTSHEETVFMTNIEAAKEIARQLRLRNIGGIIVVDFIDMMLNENCVEVVETLKREFRADRIKTRVLDMSPLGLVEITRKKSGSDISGFLLDECPECKGSSHAPSAMFIARKLKASLKKTFADNDYKSAIIQVNSHYADFLFSSKLFSKECENEWKSKRIYIIPVEKSNVKSFFITGSNASHLDLPSSARLLY